MKKYLTEMYQGGELLVVRMRQKWWELQEKRRDFLKDESGMGTIEMVLLIVVLIILVLLFRDAIRSTLQNILSQIDNSASSVWGGNGARGGELWQ